MSREACLRSCRRSGTQERRLARKSREEKARGNTQVERQDTRARARAHARTQSVHGERKRLLRSSARLLSIHVLVLLWASWAIEGGRDGGGGARAESGALTASSRFANYSEGITKPCFPIAKSPSNGRARVEEASIRKGYLRVIGIIICKLWRISDSVLA